MKFTRFAQHVLRDAYKDINWPYGFRSFPSNYFDWIIDLGANCGVVTTALRFLYPAAQIIALEPESTNYQCLEENTSGLNIITVNKALSNLAITDLYVHGAKTCCRTISSGNHFEVVQVEGVTLTGLFNKYNIKGRVGVKMDIEGGEKLFLDNTGEVETLQKCEYVGAELHAIGATLNDYIQLFERIGIVKKLESNGSDKICFVEVLLNDR